MFSVPTCVLQTNTNVGSLGDLNGIFVDVSKNALVIFQNFLSLFIKSPGFRTLRTWVQSLEPNPLEVTFLFDPKHSIVDSMQIYSLLGNSSLLKKTSSLIGFEMQAQVSIIFYQLVSFNTR